MTFEVNGVNLLPYVAEGGLKWSENDLDSSNSGRTLDGTMHRGRVAIKKKLEVTCRPLATAQSRIVLTAIAPEFVDVTYDDPKDGLVTKRMYCSTRPAACLTVFDDGTALWDDISFNLIER